MYQHRRFQSPASVAEAVRVLSAHAGRTSYGRGAREVPFAGSLADQVDALLTGDAWAAFEFRGREVAGWADGQLVVHGSGPWDAELENIRHDLLPWSWLEVNVAHDRGGGGCSPEEPLPQSVRQRFVETELIAWLAPVGVDTLSVWGETVNKRRSIRKLSDQLLVCEPINQVRLKGSPDGADLAQWWTGVLDRVGNKYRLGKLSATAPQSAVVPLTNGVVSPMPSVKSVRVTQADSDNSRPTHCPACGAPPEQSTDPSDLSRSVCYCGHPRFYDYKHEAGECPCQDGRTTPR